MDRIEKLLSAMTLAEKVSMCAGSGPWHGTGVERLGIPSLKVTDGPNGARGDMKSGCSAACFPVGSAMGATWNPALLREVGAALGLEAKSKGCQVLLGPTVNLHRHPLGGRHFECYSEDPELTARLAVAFIEGVQSQDVAACIKHFVCNDSEFERHTISSDVEERPLRELYLRPFEAAVREASVWSVMSAYNRINGTYASSHQPLLTGVLKQEWGFDGFVVSDWGAARETVANALGGLDLEMPGTVSRGPKLLAAVERGEIPEAAIDDMVRRLLRVTIRTGRLDDPEEKPERSEDRPEHRALARRVAHEAMVLAKNEGGVLPLDSRSLSRVAVIGPNAELGRIQGGGSSIVKPHYETHPLNAIREHLGDAVEVVYEQGCFTDKYAPALERECLRPASGESRPGLTIEFWNGRSFEGPPAARRVVGRSSAHWLGPASPAPGVDVTDFSARYSGTFTPTVSGPHEFGLMSAGRSRLYVDERLLIDNWQTDATGDAFFGASSPERRASIELEAGEDYLFRVDYQRDDRSGAPGVQFGCLTPDRQDRIQEAVAAASNADVAIVVVGTNGEWESEGHDRKSLELPGRQQELIERVAAANPRTIVVLNAGSPVELSWLERVPAMLQVWFAGMEFGNALADVLFGIESPSGRLPTTWPRRIEDTPAHTSYPGEDGHVLYGEGLFVGYRWYDARKIEPALPFGHGLTYSTFEYGALASPARVRAGESFDVSLEIRNTGRRAACEVVQLYVHDRECARIRPEKELRAFAKVRLEAGESTHVALRLDERALSYWDPAAHAWRAEPGEFEILVGASASDIRQRATSTLVE